MCSGNNLLSGLLILAYSQLEMPAVNWELTPWTVFNTRRFKAPQRRCKSSQYVMFQLYQNTVPKRRIPRNVHDSAVTRSIPGDCAGSARQSATSFGRHDERLLKDCLAISGNDCGDRLHARVSRRPSPLFPLQNSYTRNENLSYLKHSRLLHHCHHVHCAFTYLRRIGGRRFRYAVPLARSSTTLHLWTVDHLLSVVLKPFFYWRLHTLAISFYFLCSILSVINSFILSVSLIHILVFHLLTTLHKSDPHCHHHNFHHQSLLRCFTLDLKHISSSSLFRHTLLHRYSLDWSHGLPAGPFFSCSSVLF